MNRHRISRRGVLRSSLLVASGAGAIAAFDAGTALGSTLGGAELIDDAERATVLVVVHLRGGADGLSLCVPHRDSGYYRARPRLAVLPPGRGAAAAIDLDGRHGLHPALAAFVPLFDSGELLVVNGVGPEHHTQSHLDAERELASAVPMRITHAESLSLRDQLNQIAKRGHDAGASRVEWARLDGWDTHVAQGVDSHGRFWRQAAELARAVTAFYLALGEDKHRVVVAMLSELGRSVRENTTAGTDDGLAGTALVLGGGIRGGRVWGAWPDLQKIPNHGGLPASCSAPALLRSLLPPVLGRGPR